MSGCDGCEAPAPVAGPRVAACVSDAGLSARPSYALSSRVSASDSGTSLPLRGVMVRVPSKFRGRAAAAFRRLERARTEFAKRYALRGLLLIGTARAVTGGIDDSTRGDDALTDACLLAKCVQENQCQLPRPLPGNIGGGRRSDAWIDGDEHDFAWPVALGDAAGDGRGTFDVARNGTGAGTGVVPRSAARGDACGDGDGAAAGAYPLKKNILCGHGALSVRRVCLVDRRSRR